jgi:hypothetical protein
MIIVLICVKVGENGPVPANMAAGTELFPLIGHHQTVGTVIAPLGQLTVVSQVEPVG